MKTSPFAIIILRYRSRQSHVSQPFLRLAEAIQHRTLDPDAEVYLGRTLILRSPQRMSWRWRMGLTLSSAYVLLSIALAFSHARQDGTDLGESFLPAIGLIFALPTWRLLAPTPSRSERIYL